MSAPTTYASGTQTATLTTEHFLSSPNVAAVYVLTLDLVNMVAGDVLEVRFYKMTLTGGTARVYDLQTFQGVQPVDGFIQISVPIGQALAETNGLRFSIKQTLGAAGRNFPWSVEQYL